MTVTLRKKLQNGKHYYYSLHDRQSGLFDAFTLTATWGSRPDGGRSKIYSFATRSERDRALRSLIRKRIRQGYWIFYSYARKGNYLKVLHEFGGEAAQRRAN